MKAGKSVAALKKPTVQKSELQAATDGFGLT